MNKYFYILAFSMFVIAQMNFVNYTTRNIDMNSYPVTLIDETEAEPIDINELIMSYIFDDAEIDDETSSMPITMGMARNIVQRAYFEKYNAELIFVDEEIDLEAPITREDFAVLFSNLCTDEEQINFFEYLTDVEQSSANYEAIASLYRVGIISGNSYYGHFSGSSDISAKNVKVMVSRLKNPEERVTFAPVLQNTSFALEYNCVKQNPELPTGCEVTSLTSVLNHYGYGVDKLTMADVYLDKGNIGETDPSVSFIGSPYQRSSYGCYAPVIENCADKFLAENQSPLSTYRLEGVTFDNLLLEVEQGHPVIVWASIGMKQTYNSSVWNIDGKQITWIANEHCLVLYGFDMERNVVLVADPLVGNVEYDIDLFRTRYDELNKQAVVIK